MIRQRIGTKSVCYVNLDNDKIRMIINFEFFYVLILQVNFIIIRTKSGQRC